MLEFRKGDETKTEKDADGNEIQVPTGALVLSGKDVESAKAGFSAEDGTTPVVSLKLKDSGTKAFMDDLRCRNGNLNIICGRETDKDSI